MIPSTRIHDFARTSLGAAPFDVGLFAGAVDDRGALLVDTHLLGRAEHVERDVLRLDAEILADHLGDRGSFEMSWHSDRASAIRYSAMWDRIRGNTTQKFHAVDEC